MDMEINDLDDSLEEGWSELPPPPKVSKDKANKSSLNLRNYLQQNENIPPKFFTYLNEISDFLSK